MLVKNNVIEKNAAASRRSSVIFASNSLYVFIMFLFCSPRKCGTTLFALVPGRPAVATSPARPALIRQAIERECLISVVTRALAVAH
ncbi:hypothetical protein [Martelella radicis]|uniref:Uncharacterized protein n=1 Tax=Martelella radicis TaxID=1397476 RepID=A0A7W6KF91_9HYPH|nr:hypothetical protein [Martelella radicis]MBB4120164.1 hypothetical protein [Martelella radicis]